MVKKAIAVFLAATIMGIGIFGSYAAEADVNAGENAQHEEQRGFSPEAKERKKYGEKTQREDGNMPPQRDFAGTQNEKNRGFPDDEHEWFNKPKEGEMPGIFEFDKKMGGREKPNRGDFPPEIVTEETEDKKDAAELIAEYKTPIFSLIILAAAFVFVIFYRRKRF